MSGIKSLVVPEDICLVNPLTGSPISSDSGEPQIKLSFSDFVHKFLNFDEFKSTIENLRIALELSKTFTKCKPGDKVLVSEKDLTLFSGVVERRFTSAYTLQPFLLMQLLPFLDTLLKAEDFVNGE